MDLAHRYRLKFAAQRGDRIVLYLAIAMALHLGILTWVLRASDQPTHPSDSLEQPAQPIEFVYLDVPDTQPPVVTEHRSSVNAVAGGTQKADAPVNAGKPGLENRPASPTVKPILPSSPANVGRVVPAIANSGPSTKSLEPEADPKPKSRNTPSVMHGATPSALPHLQASSPIAPTESAQSPSNASSSPQVAPPVSPAESAQEPDNAGAGLDGSTNPNRTTDSNEVGIDTAQDPILGTYISTVDQKVDHHWQQVAPDTTRVTVVRFTLNREGQLENVSIKQSSGSDDIDQIALQAVIEAAPFDPLPSSYPGDQLVINFTFSHRVGVTP
ncbi:MAG TPA: TonB family protein [Crinalium sp.]|jgi:protein TonB